MIYLWNSFFKWKDYFHLHRKETNSKSYKKKYIYISYIRSLFDASAQATAKARGIMFLSCQSNRRSQFVILRNALKERSKVTGISCRFEIEGKSISQFGGYKHCIDVLTQLTVSRYWSEFTY